MPGMRILHLESEISDVTNNWVWRWLEHRWLEPQLEHGHSGLSYSEYGFMQHLEFTKTVCVQTQKRLQIHVEVVSGLSRSICGLCAGCLQIGLPSAAGDQNVVKLCSWCPRFSLTLLRCPIKPLLALMPAQHWYLQEWAEASYLSCSHKYEGEGSRTHKGNWGNIVYLSEEFPLVKYEVSFSSGHYQVCALNTLLLKILMPALWS